MKRALFVLFAILFLAAVSLLSAPRANASGWQWFCMPNGLCYKAQYAGGVSVDGWYYRRALSCGHRYRCGCAYAYTPYITVAQYKAQYSSAGGGWRDLLTRYAVRAKEHQLEQSSYMESIRELGLSGVFSYGESTGASAYGAYGSYAQQGATIFGQQQTTLTYGQPDINVLFGMAERLATQSNDAGERATSNFTALVDAATSGNARVAEIIAQGIAAANVLDAAKPQPSTTSSSLSFSARVGADGTAGGEGTGTVTVDTRSPVVVAALQVAFRAEGCVTCHNTETRKGGLDLSAIAEWDVDTWAHRFNGPQQIKERVRTAEPSLRMPPPGDDGTVPAVSDSSLSLILSQ